MEKERVKSVSRELQLQHSRELGTVTFHGNSMYPFLQDGDELISAPVDWIAIRPGDIITYRWTDKYPTYRVVRKTRDEIVLKPDNWESSVRVGSQQVLGKVVERRRHGQVLKNTDWRWIARAYCVRWRDYLLPPLKRSRGWVRRSVRRVQQLLWSP